ncbi:hypothetical protein [Halomonas ventosae]|uniref:Uncharacterized protein n=1 Tax=Halomonas ventosae TaxID=229007 RepID=A0A2T0VPA5_9GAMM|nr:hypothetical protein [Halomonas ventosae]PRY72256.1 hypothetical protein BCL64_10475 [Halomonas ventosae]
MHQVERAIFDLRRGLPVVVIAGDTRVLVQAIEGAIEGAGEEAVSRLAGLAGDTPALVLSRHRLAILGEREARGAARLPLPEGTGRRRLVDLAFGIAPEVAMEREALYGRLNDHNRRYLSAKSERAGHLLDAVFDGDQGPTARS